MISTRDFSVDTGATYSAIELVANVQVMKSAKNFCSSIPLRQKFTYDFAVSHKCEALNDVSR